MEDFENIRISDDEYDFAEFLTWERRQYKVKQRINHFEILDDQDFYFRFRLSKETVLMVLTLIEHALEYPTDRNNAIRPIDQLLLCLRFYATGSMLLTAADFINVSKSSACKIVKKVSVALASLSPRFIKMPTTAAEIADAQVQFFSRAQLPRIIGSLDCTHIRIQSPGGNQAETFRNRKGYFSINTQTIASANLKIWDIVARWPGSCHDQTILNNSGVKRRLENGEFGQNSLLVADSGYANTMHVITPFIQTNDQIQERYNEAVIRTRNPVERQYGVWKRRFPVLSLGLRLKLQTTLDAIVATAVLHNIAIEAKEQELELDPQVNVNNIDFDEEINVEPPANDNPTNAREQLLHDHFLRLN